MVYKIWVFDDGNKKYESYENVWEMYNLRLGKISLRNIKDPTIEIKSISLWKCHYIMTSLS